MVSFLINLTSNLAKHGKWELLFSSTCSQSTITTILLIFFHLHVSATYFYMLIIHDSVITSIKRNFKNHRCRRTNKAQILMYKNILIGIYCLRIIKVDLNFFEICRYWMSTSKIAQSDFHFYLEKLSLIISCKYPLAILHILTTQLNNLAQLTRNLQFVCGLDLFFVFVVLDFGQKRLVFLVNFFIINLFLILKTESMSSRRQLLHAQVASLQVPIIR